MPVRTISTRKRHDLTLGRVKVTVAHILTVIQPFFSTGMLSVICLTGHTLSRLGQRNDDYSTDFQQHQACHGKTFIEKVEKCNNFTKISLNFRSLKQKNLSSRLQNTTTVCYQKAMYSAELTFISIKSIKKLKQKLLIIIINQTQAPFYSVIINLSLNQ